MKPCETPNLNLNSCNSEIQYDLSVGPEEVLGNFGGKGLQIMRLWVSVTG